MENVNTHSPRDARLLVSGCLYTARGPKLWVVMAIPRLNYPNDEAYFIS